MYVRKPKSVLSKLSLKTVQILTDLELDLGADALVAGPVVLLTGCILGNAAFWELCFLD